MCSREIAKSQKFVSLVGAMQSFEHFMVLLVYSVNY